MIEAPGFEIYELVPGAWWVSGMVSVVALLAFGAFLLMLPHPGNVVMAQEFMPRSAGIAASMITGPGVTCPIASPSRN